MMLPCKHIFHTPKGNSSNFILQLVPYQEDFLHHFHKPCLDLLIWILIVNLALTYHKKLDLITSSTSQFQDLPCWQKQFKHRWKKLVLVIIITNDNNLHFKWCDWAPFGCREEHTLDEWEDEVHTEAPITLGPYPWTLGWLASHVEQDHQLSPQSWRESCLSLPSTVMIANCCKTRLSGQALEHTQV